jgi:diaminopimelate epimerase
VHMYGSSIRWNEVFQSQGTNVNFIEQKDSKTILLRTYERGVEAETLACGTGSVASAIVASVIWNLKPPIKIIPTSKIPLRVSFKRIHDNISDVYLKGPALTTYTGILSA